MDGWLSCEMALASRSKRALRSGLPARCSRRTLIWPRFGRGGCRWPCRPHPCHLRLSARGFHRGRGGFRRRAPWLTVLIMLKFSEKRPASSRRTSLRDARATRFLPSLQLGPERVQSQRRWRPFSLSLPWRHSSLSIDASVSSTTQTRGATKTGLPFPLRLYRSRSDCAWQG